MIDRVWYVDDASPHDGMLGDTDKIHDKAVCTDVVRRVYCVPIGLLSAIGWLDDSDVHE